MQAKEIKAKIKAIGNIKKITRTMEMVSVAKMRKLSEQVKVSATYAQSALTILSYLSEERGIAHQLLTERPEAKRSLIVIIASNKGLCGGYNTNVNRKVRDLSVSLGADTCDAITVGKQAQKIARRNGLQTVACFEDFGEVITSNEARKLQYAVTQKYLEGDYKNAYSIFTQFHKPMSYTPTVVQLYPVSASVLDDITSAKAKTLGVEASGRVSSDTMAMMMFEPSEEAVLNDTLPLLIAAVLLQMLLEALAAEHSSRMVAMRGATDNAGNLIDELKVTYNKARQAAITSEIAEIVGGAAALQN